MKYSEVGKFGRVRLRREKQKIIIKTLLVVGLGSSALAGLSYLIYPYILLLLETVK